MVQLDQLRHYRSAGARPAWRSPRGEPHAGAAAGAAGGAPGARDQVGRGRPRRAGRARAAGCGVAQAARPRTARDMVSGRGTRLADAGQVLGSGRPCAGRRCRTTQLARELCILRAELATQGLTGAGTHVRINAIQLHNAIRKTIGMDHAPDDPTHRLTYVNAIARLIETTEPQTINFGSVTDERATARRMFMTMTQMLKHLDGSEPIRFLIAECETSFTLLTALYFARLFGDRRPDRHLAPVRDPHRAGARCGDHRGRAGRAGLPRLSAPARPDLHPDRLLRRRPLHGPARRLRADREDPARHGRGPGRRTAWPTSSSPSSTRTARASAAAPIPAASPTGCATTTRRRAAAGSPPPASRCARRPASRAATAISTSWRRRARWR